MRRQGGNFAFQGDAALVAFFKIGEASHRREGMDFLAAPAFDHRSAALA